MICSACREQRHIQCLNEGRDTNTWCDCQHRAPGAGDVVIEWVLGEDGVTRKVGGDEYARMAPSR
jgi:hypothetical protein